MTDQLDERQGLPSGSSALQDSLCSGRFQLQKVWDAICPEAEPEETEEGNPDDIDSDREAGKRIHLLYAGKECPGASQAEIDRAERALKVDAKMRADWLSSIGADENTPVVDLRETRWWLTDEAGQRIYSGQTDAVWFTKNADGSANILVADLKGLWGHHDAAPLNVQLRRYIALIAVNADKMGYTEIRSATAYLNQPAKTLTPTPTRYDAEKIQMAVMEMHMDIAAIMDPEAKRTAGPVQCHHCRAKLICPEFEREQQTLMMTVVEQSAKPPDKDTIISGVNQLSTPTLSRLLSWVPALRDLCDLAQMEGKRRLREDPNSIPGWFLKPNAPRSKIEDISTVFARCSAEWSVGALQFTQLCSITKTDVIKLVRSHSKLRGQQLDAKVAEILAGATRPIKVGPSLQRLW